MGELLFLLVFELLGPFIVLGLIIWGVVVLLRGRRLKKSVSASKGDAAAMALEGLRARASALRFLALILGPAAFCLALNAGAGFGTACIAGGLVYVATALWSGSLRGRYNTQFKETFVAAELSRVFTALEYRPKEAFDAGTLRDLGFFAPFSALSGSDLITAQYRGIRFTQSDIRLVHTLSTRDEDGRTQDHSHQFFNGRVMRFDFEDAFKGDVQVLKRNFVSARVMDHPGEWQTVETELAAFGEDFLVFTKDPVAAMTVLTPQMIEGVHYLDKALRVPLALYFTGRAMFVFMALGRDAFDTSKKKTLLEEREFLQKDIALITGFLETMYFKEWGDAAKDAGNELPVPEAGAKEPFDALSSGARDSLQRLGYKVSYFGKWAGRAVFFAPLAVYLASAAYMLSAFPDGFFLSYSSVGDAVTLGDNTSTPWYLLGASVFAVPATLGAGYLLGPAVTALLGGGGTGFPLAGRIKGLLRAVAVATLILLPFWIHMFYLNANMLYR